MKSLVLVPGLLCNQALWSDQIAGLACYAEIVVADLTEQETIPEMASAVLERSPERFGLAGFSLGSQVALEIMRAGKSRVERLALLSATHGGLLPPVKNAIRHAIETIEAGSFGGYLEAVYPTYVAAARVNDPVVKRRFVEMAQAVGQDAGLRQMRALLAIKEPFPNLDQIHCLTVVIGGRDDRRTTPAAHAALAQEIPARYRHWVAGALDKTLTSPSRAGSSMCPRFILDDAFIHRCIEQCLQKGDYQPPNHPHWFSPAGMEQSGARHGSAGKGREIRARSSFRQEHSRRMCHANISADRASSPGARCRSMERTRVFPPG